MTREPPMKDTSGRPDIVDEPTFEALERHMLAQLSALDPSMPDGAKRISVRIQAAFNYAMAQEVQTRGQWQLYEAIDGLEHATVAIWTVLLASMPDKFHEAAITAIQRAADEIVENADNPEAVLSEEFGVVNGADGGRA